MCTRSLMDRILASDAKDAGSIPVGCILCSLLGVYLFNERQFKIFTGEGMDYC